MRKPRHPRVSTHPAREWNGSPLPKFAAIAASGWFFRIDSVCYQGDYRSNKSTSGGFHAPAHARGAIYGLQLADHRDIGKHAHQRDTADIDQAGREVSVLRQVSDDDRRDDARQVADAIEGAAGEVAIRRRGRRRGNQRPADRGQAVAEQGDGEEQHRKFRRFDVIGHHDDAGNQQAQDDRRLARRAEGESRPAAAQSEKKPEHSAPSHAPAKGKARHRGRSSAHLRWRYSAR